MVKVKIRKIGANAVRANLAADDDAAPYCGFLYAMWKDVQVDLNHKAHSTTHGFYDIVTYLKILYQMPNDVKSRQLMNSMWMRDIQGGHSMVANDVAVNPGQYYRIQRAAASRTMELSGKLLVDCLNVARPIPDNVSINITYYPNEAKKCILSAVALNTVIEIQDFYLMVPRVFPKPALLGAPTLIPWLQTTVHRFIFVAGSQNFGPRSIVHSDTLPRRALVVILTETQLNGRADLCRQEFNHRNVSQMLITVNGEHYPYINGYQTDFNNGEYSLLFDALFTELGDGNTVDINREQFTGGYVVFPMDLTQKHLSDTYYPPKRSGQIEIQAQFSQAPAANLVILVLLEEERVLSFDRKREFVDYPALSK